MNLLYCFPEGKAQALTFSYDDGTIHDRTLVDIFNRYGMKATFHLNSGLNDNPDHVKYEEYPALYAGHEVACHGLTHHNYPRIPPVQTIEEIRRDRKILESVIHYPVRGLSYPCGRYDDDSIAILKTLGIVYSRTVQSTGRFDIPEDFMKWHPTAHHKANIAELGKRLVKETYGLNLLYIWGHSYEFDNDGNWDLIESFCSQMKDIASVWYATNIEIYDYVQACRRLIFGIDGKLVSNPSAIPVWIKNNWEPVRIEPGATVELK